MQTNDTISITNQLFLGNNLPENLSSGQFYDILIEIKKKFNGKEGIDLLLESNV